MILFIIIIRGTNYREMKPLVNAWNFDKIVQSFEITFVNIYIFLKNVKCDLYVISRLILR
jgi:hypothetical protein